MNLPNGDTYVMAFNETRMDKFFAPYLEVTEAGELLWEYSMDPEEIARAREVKNDSNILCDFMYFSKN